MHGARRWQINAPTNIHSLLLFMLCGDLNVASAGYREQRDGQSQFHQLIALCSKVGNDRTIDGNGK
jgi:hypothetical protein